MKKSDKSRHNIVIASIKRSTMKPHDFKWTKFYEEKFVHEHPALKLDLENNELLICSTVINSNNYSILTTRKLLTVENGKVASSQIDGLVNIGYGEFKSDKKDFTFGTVKLKTGDQLKYFIETGKASMIMIQGVKTIIQIQDNVLTNKNIEQPEEKESISNWLNWGTVSEFFGLLLALLKK